MNSDMAWVRIETDDLEVGRVNTVVAAGRAMKHAIVQLEQAMSLAGGPSLVEFITSARDV
jgi:hypothetical protein